MASQSIQVTSQSQIQNVGGTNPQGQWSAWDPLLWSIQSAGTAVKTAGTIQGSNFGFSIPAGATIDGIETTWRLRASPGTNNQPMYCSFRIDGSAEDRQVDIPISSAYSYPTLGSPTDKWGETWTPARINSPSFKTAMSQRTTFNYATWWAGEPRITVYYTEAIPVDNASHAVTSTSTQPTVPVPQSTPIVGISLGYGSDLGYGHELGGAIYNAMLIVLLAMDNANHTLTSTSPNLIQNSSIVVEDTTHTITSTSVSLTENYKLIVESTFHDVGSPPISFIEGSVVYPASTGHDVTSSSPTLISQQKILVNNTTHSIISDSIELIQVVTLSKPEDSIHSITSDEVEVAIQINITADDSIHSIDSTTIGKIVDWTYLGVEFGPYIPLDALKGILDSSGTNILLFEDLSGWISEDGKHLIVAEKSDSPLGSFIPLKSGTLRLESNSPTGLQFEDLQVWISEDGTKVIMAEKNINKIGAFIPQGIQHGQY